ncbi:MAG: hypothetical protein ACEQSX_04285 [Baekduiaceae bacterium]
MAALHNCLLRPDLDGMMRAGERRYALAVATSQRQAALIIDIARSIIDGQPALQPLVERDTEDELWFRLPSGARTGLRALPCSSRGGRGWPVSLLVMDEAAHFLDGTAGPAVADRVWEALVPSTAQFGELARIIVASTPYGNSNLFARLYWEAAAGKLPGAVAVKATTAEMGGADEEFLKTERLRDPGSFPAEYEAEFLASGDAFVDMERVEFRGEVAPPGAGRDWICGLDPAFARKGDDFGVALVGRSVAAGGELVVGPVLALRPGGNFGETLDQVADVILEYGARGVTDQYSAPAVLEHLRRRGVTVRQHTMTATTKTDIFSEMRARLYDRTLKAPDSPALRAELGRLQTRFSAGSAGVVNPRVGASHGDRAQALALAVFEFRREGGGRSVFAAYGLGDVAISRGGLTLRGERYMDKDDRGHLVLPAGYEREERTW